jgi:hypothetical protein
MSPSILHAIIVVAEIVAYTVLTVLGHDGNVIFAVFGGQAIGAVIQSVSSPKVTTPSVPPSRSTVV